MAIDAALKKAQDLNRRFFLISSNQTRSVFYVKPNAHPTIVNAAKQLSATMKHITGAEIQIVSADFDCVQVKNAVFFTLVEDYPILKEWFPYETDFVADGEGFAIRVREGNCYIFASLPNAIFYGAMDMIEQATDVIWTRGKADESELFKKEKTIYLFCNYYDKPYFEIRGWNFHGTGEGGQGLDLNTAIMIGKNKLNSKFGTFEREYLEYGILPFATIPKDGLFNFDYLINTKPDLFMKDSNRKPKTNLNGVSYLNYYNPICAELVAQSYIKALEESPEYINYICAIKSPEDDYFYVKQNNEVISDKPFVADDGTQVFPEQKEYKSTVYFNFFNRVVNQIASVYPNIKLFNLAKGYLEHCPKISICKNGVIGVVPSPYNAHFSFVSSKADDSIKKVFDNVKNWCEKCSFVTVHEDWQKFDGKAYSLPNAYVIQENIKEYYKLGVRGIVPEGWLDQANALGEDMFFDLNELYFHIINRLSWNFEANIFSIKSSFCDLAYGNAFVEMFNYYKLIEKGFDQSDCYFDYTYSSEFFVKEFIVKAGLADEIKLTLDKALTKKITDVQRRKIQSIRDVVFSEIDKCLKDN